jgi:hypothetical protein
MASDANKTTHSHGRLGLPSGHLESVEGMHVAPDFPTAVEGETEKYEDGSHAASGWHAFVPRASASTASLSTTAKDNEAQIDNSCGVCGRRFVRVCDLEKHLKVHTRPFKCPVSTCKYANLGWPTEKELDRHRLDKHTEPPQTFPCQYVGCSYHSKRESNVKQHMEKKHGWQYVRSRATRPKINVTGSPDMREMLADAPNEQRMHVDSDSADEGFSDAYEFSSFDFFGSPQRRVSKFKVETADDFDDNQMPCPFRLADPAYFSRYHKEKFSPCHTMHKDISTIVRHLGRPAHQLHIDERCMSSFEPYELDDERPRPKAGVCKRCWRIFRDHETFREHIALPCARVSMGKRKKFTVLYEAFCTGNAGDLHNTTGLGDQLRRVTPLDRVTSDLQTDPAQWLATLGPETTLSYLEQLNPDRSELHALLQRQQDDLKKGIEKVEQMQRQLLSEQLTLQAGDETSSTAHRLRQGPDNHPSHQFIDPPLEKIDELEELDTGEDGREGDEFPAKELPWHIETMDIDSNDERQEKGDVHSDNTEGQKRRTEQFTDSGYASAPAGKIISQPPTQTPLDTQDDTSQTAYTDVSVVFGGTMDQCVSEFADELYRSLCTSSHASGLGGITNLISDLLKEFAIRIGYLAPSKGHCDLMYFVHKFRR